MLFFASANFLLVATTTERYLYNWKFHSESLTKRCRVYEWLCRRVEVVCISKKCRTAAHRSVKTVSCKAIGRSAWKSNQDKHLDKYLAFLGWIRASLRESAIFSKSRRIIIFKQYVFTPWWYNYFTNIDVSDDGVSVRQQPGSLPAEDGILGWDIKLFI